MFVSTKLDGMSGSLLNAMALTTVVWLIGIGVVYKGDAPVGTLPSIVYRIETLLSGEEIVTVMGLLYPPAGRSNRGVVA